MSGGIIIGEVKGAGVDTNTWRVPVLHIKLLDTAATELGFKKRFRSATVCIPTTMIKEVGDVVTMAPSISDLGSNIQVVEC